MIKGRLKCLLVLVFSVISLSFFNVATAQENDHVGHDEKAPETTQKEEKVFDANEVIFDHVLDAHEFHFLAIKMPKVTSTMPPFLFP